MGTTKIEWCDITYNCFTGCTPVSEACQNCYAKRLSKRFAGRFGYPKDDPFRLTIHYDKLDLPDFGKKPKRIFINSMSDTFHEDVPEDVIRALYWKMLQQPRHTFLLLTKRAKRMNELAWKLFRDGRKAEMREPTNIMLGITAENQERFDERFPYLANTPGCFKRFVSFEPLFEHINIESNNDIYAMDWAICGGQTGPGSLPVHPDWVCSLRDQCKDMKILFLFKSWGDWAPIRNARKNDLFDARKRLIVPVKGEVTSGLLHYDETAYVMERVGKRASGRTLDGIEHNEFPTEAAQCETRS